MFSNLCLFFGWWAVGLSSGNCFKPSAQTSGIGPFSQRLYRFEMACCVSHYQANALPAFVASTGMQQALIL